MSTARGLSIAALGALLSAVFVAVRSPLPFPAFLVVAAAVALVEGALLAALPSASAGLRGALVGLGLATAPLYVLAKVLKATTHHRPLGAVTFAFIAVVVTVGAVVVALRVVGERWASRRGRVISAGLEIAAAIAVALVLFNLLRDPATQGGAVDIAFALGSAALLVLLRWPARASAVLERVGPWLWAALVISGLGFALGSARLAAAASSPALTALVAWF